jgi:hypothetical protein
MMNIKKVNYLNNKDLLKEIHKSKTNYCSYSKPEYSDYDIIIRDLSVIPSLLNPKTETRKIVDEDTEEVTTVTATFPPEAMHARALRLTKLLQAEELLGGKRPKSELTVISHDTIKPQDVVFRLMTWDHIPEAPKAEPKLVKGKKAKMVMIDDDSDLLEELEEIDLPASLATPTPTKYVKVNFPAFQHYILDDNLQPVMVGKSHWKGDINTGAFCKDHGQITNKLATMYMKLCDRYATRSNWRGYTYNDEMRAQALLQLTQVGLQFDESKSQNPFAYYTAAITNSFIRVLNTEKRNQNIRDDILEMNNLNPSYTRQGMGSGVSHDGGYED